MRWTLNLLLAAAIAALTIALLTVRPAAANVFAADGVDPREPVVSTSGPSRFYAPIARVRTLGPVMMDDGRTLATRGTGFLVSPCLLVTNFHAVFGHVDKAVLTDGPMVEVTLTSAADQPLKARGTPVAWGGISSTGVDDWAVVKLEECLGGRADVGWFQLDPASESQLSGISLETAGYPGDKRGLVVHGDCTLRGLFDHSALTDCANKPGSSGSPLFRFVGDVPSVVAIMRGQRNMSDKVLDAYNTGHANTAVTVARLMSHPDVAALIAADRNAFGADNPLARPAPLYAPPTEVAPIVAAELPPIEAAVSAPVPNAPVPSAPAAEPLIQKASAPLSR